MNKLYHNNKGQAMVEFAIILPILLLLIMGIIEFGLMLNSYLTIENASREGARIGIVGASDSDITNRIISDCPNLDASDIKVTITPGDGSRNTGDTLTVKVSYNYQMVTPIISDLLSNSITLNAQTSMRVE